MTQTTPLISVVIPTHARAPELKKCLTALTRVDYPRECFEVLVVDDGSPMPLNEVVTPFWPRIAVRLLRQHCSGPGAARNTGVAAARGEFIAFTADDCTPAPDWLRRLAERFVESPECAVGGRIVNALPQNPFSASTDLMIRYLYDYYNRPTHEARFFTPNNLAFPARQLRGLGGFEPSFPTGEDRELCDRWRSAGYGMVYAPEVVVAHTHPLNLIGFWNLHFRYGQGSSRFRRRSAARRSAPASFEPLSFYVNLVRYPFATGEGMRAMLLSGLLGISQIANAIGFFHQSLTQSRHRRRATA